MPLDRPLRALSVGSSTEPQFRYTTRQRREITAHVYRNLFARRAALFQDQDHLVVYRGLRGRGLI